MEEVVLQDLMKKYHTDHVVVRNVSLSVQPGELVSLLGPSGCGKTTLLRMVAGLLGPDQGAVRIRGKDVTSLPAFKRDIGMVFQNYALFPHMTIAKNIAFGLKRRRINSQEIRERVNSALEMVNLSGFGDRYPKSLSGGQQQRVALARALVLHPAVLLLDEPLSALDAKLRVETRDEIRRLQQELGLATIFVTHDQEEALVMSDRIAVMNQGVIQQLSTPSEVFERPRNEFVARFMGIPNVFQAKWESNDVYRTSTGWKVHASDTSSNVSAVAVRPDRVSVQSMITNGPVMGDSPMNAFSGTVVERTYTGSMIRFIVRTDSGETVTATVPTHMPSAGLQPGDSAVVGWEPSDTILLVPEISQ